MADVELVIKVPEELYKALLNGYEEPYSQMFSDVVKNGTPLPKGHGKLVDIGKIDEDRIESDNPIIYLTINGEYTEAVSLDYLNSLPTIIEANKED